MSAPYYPPPSHHDNSYRDSRGMRDSRDTRDTRDSRDNRDNRDSRDSKDSRDTRDSRDSYRREERRGERGGREREYGREETREERRSSRRSHSPVQPAYVPKPKNYISGWDVPPTADGIAQQATVAQFYSSRAPESDQKAAGHSSKLGNMATTLSGIHGMAATLGGKGPSLTSALPRRLYFGNLKVQIDDSNLRAFINDKMNHCIGITGESVETIELYNEKFFAFVVFRTPEEAQCAMELDRLLFEGEYLTVRRPSDFNPLSAPPINPNGPTMDLQSMGIKTNVPSEFGIYCGGLPYDLGENDIKEMFGAFGELTHFEYPMSTIPGENMGYCFFAYQSSELAEAACSMHGVALGERTLIVRRMNISKSIVPVKAPASVSGSALHENPFEHPTLLSVPSRILCLLSLVDESELREDKEYREIKEDIQEECGKFGSVKNLLIPRPDPNGLPVAGLGKVFVEFATIDNCIAAKRGLEGRRFGERTVVATFYPESHWSSRVLF